MAIVFGKIRILKTYEEWRRVFEEHAGARRAAGIFDIMHAPVIGEQAVVYVVRTDNPRSVHDMLWDPQVRVTIASSGHLVGSEEFTICDEVPGWLSVSGDPGNNTSG